MNPKSASYHSNTVCDHYHKDIFGSSPSLIHKRERKRGGSGGLARGGQRVNSTGRRDGEILSVGEKKK